MKKNIITNKVEDIAIKKDKNGQTVSPPFLLVGIGLIQYNACMYAYLCIVLKLNAIFCVYGAYTSQNYDEGARRRRLLIEIYAVVGASK